jgi:hypothetical protein
MPCLNSRNFSEKWFLDKVHNWQEVTRLDFKRELSRLTDDKEKFEFAKDLIAFGNVARRTGEPCWIFFGVAEKEGRAIYDVSNQYPGKKKPEYWDNPQVSIHDKLNNGVTEVIRQIMRDWIEPDIPDFYLEYGEVNQKFVSYLEIRPTPSSQPYALRHRFVKGNTCYEKGSVFIRKNSSTVLLALSEVPYLLQESQAAYLDRMDWRQIVTNYKSGNFEECYSLAPNFQPKVKDQPGDALNAVIQGIDAGKRIILIRGEAGEGKTVLLHRVAYLLAGRHDSEFPTQQLSYGYNPEKAGESETVNHIQEEIEVVPLNKKVPIFMTLRTAFDSKEDFEQLLVQEITKIISKRQIDKLNRLFKIPGSQWVILLDGVDEIRNREDAGAKLGEWIRLLPSNVQVVITSRPYAVDKTLADLVIDLMPLSDEDVLFLLRGNVFKADPENAEDKFDQINEFIRLHPDFPSLLTRQRALVGFINYCVDNYLPPQIGIDQDQVVVLEKESAKLRSEGDGVVPLITTEILDSNSTLDGKATDNDVESVVPPSLILALAIRSVIKHMIDEEIKRQAEFGSDCKLIGERAGFELDKTAWHIDWRKDEFNADYCCDRRWLKEESRNWNEYLGFIHRTQYPTYRFFNPLYRRFAAAEYAFKNDDENQIIKKLQRIKHPYSAAQTIVCLLNQLRSSHGKKTLVLGG